jgi:hypothetical protein
LKVKNRETGFSVPAHGLYLTKIEYPYDNDAAIERINRMMNKNKFLALMAMETLKPGFGDQNCNEQQEKVLKTEIDQP